MSNTSPTQIRRLRRSRTDKMIGGVCGGVAEYLNMDATVVRVLTVVLTLFTGIPLVAYIVALFLIPEADVTPDASGTPVTGPSYAPYPPAPAPGPAPQAPAEQQVWGPEGPPWAATEAAGPVGDPEPKSAGSSEAGAATDKPGEGDAS